MPHNPCKNRESVGLRWEIIKEQYSREGLARLRRVYEDTLAYQGKNSMPARERISYQELADRMNRSVPQGGKRYTVNMITSHINVGNLDVASHSRLPDEQFITHIAPFTINFATGKPFPPNELLNLAKVRPGEKSLHQIAQEEKLKNSPQSDKGLNILGPYLESLDPTQGNETYSAIGEIDSQVLDAGLNALKAGVKGLILEKDNDDKITNIMDVEAKAMSETFQLVLQETLEKLSNDVGSIKRSLAKGQQHLTVEPVGISEAESLDSNFNDNDIWPATPKDLNRLEILLVSSFAVKGLDIETAAEKVNVDMDYLELLIERAREPYNYGLLKKICPLLFRVKKWAGKIPELDLKRTYANDLDGLLMALKNKEKPL